MWQVMRQKGGYGDKEVIAEALLSRQTAWDKMVNLARHEEGRMGVTGYMAVVSCDDDYTIYWLRNYNV